MFSLYWWALSSITGSILGSATNAWFKKTKMGRWFYKKIENWYTWAANRYGFEILKAEDKWRKKFPNVAREIKYLEERHDALCDAVRIQQSRIAKHEEQIKKLKEFREKHRDDGK